MKSFKSNKGAYSNARSDNSDESPMRGVQPDVRMARVESLEREKQQL